MSGLLVNFVNVFVGVLSLAIFGRVIMSWLSPRADDPLSTILLQITEPLMSPIRRFMPQFGMFDLTPMVALLLLNLVVRPVALAVL